MTQSFSALIRTMTQAIVAGDGQAAAACFTPDGVYHDVFYGQFKGLEIANLVESFFHRDGANFRWDIHEPVADANVAYARYIFSYDSCLDDFAGQRAVFEGVAVCHLRDGLIAHYSEVANAAAGLVQTGFSHERVGRFVQRQADELLARPETASHRQST